MNLLYAKLPIYFGNYIKSLEHYKSLTDDNWYWDTYRTVHMLPLYTPGGAIDKKGSQNKKNSELDWTVYADDETIEFFENNVFPWLDKKGRIILLKTPPGESLATHIDCSRDVFGTRQHKLRIVLQGEVNSLTFVTNDSEINPKSDHRNLFVMDGSWPHYMTNTFNDWKYTICLGAPWDGGPTDGYNDLLNQTEDTIYVTKDQLPENYEKYFEDPLTRKKKFEE